MKKLGILLFFLATMIASAYPPPMYYNRWDTASDTNSFNGSNLTNVPATQLSQVAIAGIVTNGQGKIDFDANAISSDGAGNLSATSYAGNGGQLTGLSSAQLVGLLPFASIPPYIVTNNSTMSQTNQSIGGIFANQFTGPLAGNATTASFANQGGWGTNALALAGSHVYVGFSTNLNTYGFSTRAGWYSSTSKGQALQDAFNYYTTNLLVYTNNGGQIFTTNYVGLTFELGPADYNNPFYRPQGYYISNLWASADWRIYGQGFPNTLIVGDSNVLLNSFNNQAGATPFEEIDHVGLCFSNYLQKTTAVNLSGVAYLQFHDNWIIPLVSVNPTNYYFGWAGGDAAGTYVPLGYSSGIIDLVISGNTGVQKVHDSIFGAGAVGVVCLAEHIRFSNDEFKYIGSDSHGHYASQWKTNDSTQIFIPDGFSSGILGCDLALGSGVIMGGAGDFSMIGDKWIGCNTGTYFKGVTPTYGRPKLTDCHFEALVTGPASDVVLANDSDATTVPSSVDAFNCYDQQTASTAGGDIDVYSFDTVTFKLALNSNMGGGGVGIGPCYLTSLSTLLSPEDTGGTTVPMFSYTVNGSKVFTYDSGNSNAVVNTNWTLASHIPPSYFVRTNWILGGKYSFTYPIVASVMPVLTLTGVAGSADLECEIVGVTTNRSAQTTLITSIAMTITNGTLINFIPANTTFDFTNRSTGAGDAAALSGGSYMIQ